MKKQENHVAYIIIVNVVILIIIFSLFFFYLENRSNKYIRLKRGELSENVDTNIQWNGICLKYKERSNDYEYLFFSDDLYELNSEFGTEYQIGDKVWVLYFESTHLMSPPLIDPIFIF